jgi:hypothetical protein
MTTDTTTTPEKLRSQADALEAEMETKRVKAQIEEFVKIQDKADRTNLTAWLGAIREASLLAPRCATGTLAESVTGWVAFEAKQMAEAIEEEETA